MTDTQTNDDLKAQIKSIRGKNNGLEIRNRSLVATLEQNLGGLITSRNMLLELAEQYKNQAAALDVQIKIAKTELKKYSKE